jgi:hypothetical protein
VTLAVTAALALAVQPAQARSSRAAGGRPGGGGRSGGSHAVPRGGSPGYSPRGGSAEARHPRAGTGSYGYGYHPYYGGHSYRPYYHGGYYGGHYGGYYGGYYGNYRPYPYASLDFGFSWPYYSGWWPYGWAGDSSAYYAPYSYTPYYAYGYDNSATDRPSSDSGYGVRPPAAGRNAGRVRLEVRPDDASVYVDDEFWGNARETKFLTLRSGRHAIELVRPGFEVARREVDVVAGETSDVLVELQHP